MTTVPFFEVLRSTVAQFQATHPERAGDLARACALIAQGMVAPSRDDPGIGEVLSSDLATTYTINGACSCPAGRHGKPCKHRDSWRLYQYITRKVEAQAPPGPGDLDHRDPPALPEARASLNFKAMIGGFEAQITLRSDTEDELLHRLQALLKRQDLRPIPTPAPRSGHWKQRSYQGRPGRTGR